MNRNLVFTGVGGQGVLLAANVVGRAAMYAGHDTRVGEVHGMSQRGGSVVAHVRYGDDVYGPMVPEGTADALVALEPMEALRYASYLGPSGPMIVSFDPEDPFSVAKGDDEYPDLAMLRAELARRGDVVEVDAAELAREAGHPKTSNVVLLGVLSECVDLGIDLDHLYDAIRTEVPDDAREVNLEAFELGRTGRRAPGTNPSQ